MKYANSRAFLAYAPLLHMAWRRLRQRPFQYVLLILGIGLGVAMIVAIDLSSSSAQRAFDLSTEAVTGKTTHRLVGGSAGLDEQLYVNLRKAGYDLSAPVIEGYVLAPRMGNHAMRLMGVDAFAEPPFRWTLWRKQDVSVLVKFLGQPNAVIISQGTAEKYQLALGDKFTLQVAGTPTTVTLVGLMATPDEITKEKSRDLIIADIATAQELFHMPGKLSHADLIIEDSATATQIAARLPPGVRLETADARTNSIRQMTSAFTINLTALSLIALLVGIFLIYNTVTFNVIQRRPLFAILRCLGVTRLQMFWLIMTESIIAGLIGTGVGLLFGIWLGEGVTNLVTRTLNDFYFIVNVRNVAVSHGSILKGLLCGILAAIVATIPPAIEAMRTTPASTLRRSSLESKVARLMPWLWASWLGLGGFGVLMLWWPADNLIMAFVGLFSVLIAFALTTPPLTRLVMLRIAPGLGRFLGPLGRMAPRDIERSLSRTSVAIAALMMAVALIVGVSMSVGSFRRTLANWLEVTLKADIYVSPPTLTSGRPSGNLPPDVVGILSKWPGVRDAVTARYATAFAPAWGRDVELMAVTGDMSDGKRPYRWIGGDQATLWSRFLAGEGVMLSEPLVSRQHLSIPPGPITLMTDSGPLAFPVLAVFADYTSDQGVVLMDQASYRNRWRDANVTTMFLFAKPGVTVETLLDQLRAKLAGREDIVIQSSRSVREASMVIFDRSFAITIALQLVATVVAFIGVLSALMSLELERAREVGIFRAVGMTVRQLWRLTLIRTMLMGTLAGLIAMPTGVVLAWILVYIINVRSFGWTMHMQLATEYFSVAFLVAVAAALAAGVYPALRLGKMSISAAIHEE
ncbi:ABC transporter permease [Mycobacterium simiae]|uniref:ABC transporter permease n=1 Tax=Mycobacterium simiae TaxID=1784 RepID=A0A5B1BWK6_MYCSI|nr:ABC transporter permease [Mycobacterium simiae]KAA1251549.1 ABC transporter permease [Mycobacterium simiae]